MSGVCTHCGERPRAYRNGLCRADYAYKRKYGKLPDVVTVARRETYAHDEVKLVFIDPHAPFWSRI